MTESPLYRFLNAVAKDEQPSLSDVCFITDALIRMHDSGESFKKAFSLNSTKGRKPSKSVNTPTTKSFQSMSEGWLGQGPFWLNRFLSAVDQQRIPNMDDLKSMSQALGELMNKKSLVAAFDMRQKTSNKKLMEDEINLNRFFKSRELEAYLLYRKLLRTKNRTEVLEAVSQKIFRGERQIERKVKQIKEYVWLIDLAKKNQKENWKAYSSFYQHIKKFKDIKDATLSYYEEPSNYKFCLVLATLYEEILENQKYALIMTGRRQYPLKLKNQVKANLEPIVKMTNSVEVNFKKRMSVI